MPVRLAINCFTHRAVRLRCAGGCVALIERSSVLNKTAPNWAPFCYEDSVDGGAGIRTPVREKIDHSVYVRIPLIEVSSRWPMESPLLDESPKFSPVTGRRGSRLSRIFDTLKAASGGLLYGQVQQLLRVTQPVRDCCSQLKNIPEVLPGPEYLGTRPQLH